jgi:radical SAM superfamily enzyme
MEEHKLLVLDDSMVMSIMNNNKIVSQIHAIKVAVDRARATPGAGGMKKGGCTPCQAKARNVAINLMLVKKTIAQLPDESKKKLKELLNAKQVRIVYRNDSGKIIQLTF